MKNLFLFLFLFQSYVSCTEKWTGVKDLGNNLKLVESNISSTSINYCTDKSSYCNSGITAIPPNIIEYNYDEKWIIAKSIGTDNDTCYWILDKNCHFKDGIIDIQLKQQTIGPIDSIQFCLELKSKVIKLQLKKK